LDDDFKSLQKLWYKKLKDSGFEDIEDFEGCRILKRSFSAYTWQHTQQDFDEIQDYFRLAGQFYYEHRFENKLEKEIWRLHSEGVSYREIAEILRTHKQKVNKDSVQKIVSKYSKMIRMRLLSYE